MATKKEGPSPSEVLKYTAPTAGFLCPITANVFGIDFLEFKIRDSETNRVYFHVRRDPDAPVDPVEELDDSSRFIRYDFGAQFLDLKNVGTTLVFRVGNAPVNNFRMIERHYFRGKLIKSFDFPFGFCIPGSTNEWEVIYEMPKLSAAEKEDMIKHPNEVKSDSFYFVDNKLVMHNKAEYSYSR